LWLLLAAYLACVGPGHRGHHLMPVLPALGLLALYPLHRLGAPGGLWARLTRQPTSAVVVVLYGYVLGQLLAGNAEQLKLCWLQKSRWYGLSYAQPQGYQLQAAEIRRLTSPGEPIYVWGFSPGTYRYAYRRCSSRFATFEKLGQLGPPARFILHQAIADIRAHPPAALVFSSDDLSGVLADTQSEFTQWLTQRYEDRGVSGGMHILARRRDMRSASPALLGWDVVGNVTLLPEEEVLHVPAQNLVGVVGRGIEAVFVDDHAHVVGPHSPGLDRDVLVHAPP
jgi:hypothetical protein